MATTTPFEPDWASPPGDTILEWIEEADVGEGDLAQRLGMSAENLNRMIRGKATLSQESALRLESVTGIPARIWNALEARYRDRLSRETRDAAAPHHWSPGAEDPPRPPHAR